MKNKKSIALIGALFTLSAFAISMNAVPPLATTIARNLEFPFESFGWVISLQFLGFALASLIGGWLSDHFTIQPRSFVLIGLAILAIGFLIGTMLRSYIAFVIWIIPLGIAGGLVEPFGSIIVTDFDKLGSARMINLSQVFYCLGAVLAPQIVAVLLIWQVEWSWIFGIFCLLITFFAVLFIILFKGSPQQNGPGAKAVREEYSGKKGPQFEDHLQFQIQTHREEPLHPPLNIGEPIYTEQGEKKQSEKNQAKNVYTDSMFIRVAAFMLFYVAVEGVIVTWIAAYFDTSLGMSPSASAWRLAIFWVGLLAGRLLIVFLPTRYGLWQPVLIGSFGMMLGVLLLSFIRNPVPATLVLLLLGFFAGPIWPSTVGLSRHLSDTNRFTTGIIAGGALGLVIVPVTSSLLISSFGFRVLFLIVGVVALLQLITLLTFLASAISKVKLDNKGGI